ncbi:MAG: hypothetical protein ABI184_04445 [Ginsengibacter sp.]
MRLIYLTLLTCIVFLSCKKNTSDSQCDYQIQDSSVLANKLIGSWKWIQTRSGATGEVSQADTLRILTFRPDSTFSYIEGATILAQGKWSLKIDPGSFLGLSLDLVPPSHHLTGSVFICNNQTNQMVLFYSYLDAPDIFFERIN